MGLVKLFRRPRGSLGRWLEIGDGIEGRISFTLIRYVNNLTLHGGLVAYFWGESRPGEELLECASANRLDYGGLSPSKR
jgi:hypothetical protein